MTAEPAVVRDLGAMHDIVMPSDPAIWPPAPGWMIFGVVLLVLMAWGGSLAILRHRALAFRREALSAIEQTTADLAPGNTRACVIQIAGVLRRVAMHVWSRERVAPLTGQDWIDFLNRHGSGAILDAEDAGTLLRACYADVDPPPEDVRRLLDTTARWIRSQGTPQR